MQKLFIFLLICLAGCSEPQTKQEKTLIVNGITYTLVRESSTNNGIVDAALYKKEGTQKLYTPSLTGRDMIPFL